MSTPSLSWQHWPTSSRENRYREAAVRTARWLDREMWNGQDGRYRVGYEDIEKATPSVFTELLDSQTWSIMAMEAAARSSNWPADAPAARNGLPWIAKQQCRLTYDGKEIAGFAKLTLGVGYAVRLDRRNRGLHLCRTDRER